MKNNKNYSEEYEFMFVSSFYIGKSKYNTEKYKMWINNFSLIVKKNLFIFCNKEGFKILSPSLKIFVKKINDIFELEKISEYKSLYKKMWNKDPEKNKHNYRLYAIWNGKISMLKYVSERVNSKIYIWIDIGSNRENKRFSTFPSIKRIKFLHKITYNSYMFFFQLSNFQNITKNKITLITKNCLEGGTFGGSKIGINNYFKVFFSLHDNFSDLNYFVGKDQTLYNTIAFFNLSRVALLKYKSKSCKNNIWFRFYDFYAGLNCASVTSTYNFIDI